jgi:hypothetical protein
MPAARTRQPPAPDVEVLELSPAQYRKVKEAALRSVGLTYKQLAKQARKREFSSPRAQKVWIAIGDHAG